MFFAIVLTARDIANMFCVMDQSAFVIYTHSTVGCKQGVRFGQS